MHAEAHPASFQDMILRLRGRTGLTQVQLAERASVHTRSVQAWESGVSFPGAATLQRLIATYLTAGGFEDGRELDEAEALWQAAEREAPRQLPPFDRGWFARELRPAPAPAPALAAIVADWGDAPGTAEFVGRAHEVADLTRFVVVDAGRVATVLGIGGVGKTSLVAHTARLVAPGFASVFWCSLHNAPSFADWSARAIGIASNQRRVPPDSDDARVRILLDLLREQRCLFVLDNFESLLEPGVRPAAYREGFDGYGALIGALAQSDHQSCLLITSREAPPNLEAIAGAAGRSRTFNLAGLRVDDARQLLTDKRLSGDETAWAHLVSRYGGNGLALRIVGETIRQVFSQDIESFLAEAPDISVFGGVRALLDRQFERLSAAERDILLFVATSREPITFNAISRFRLSQTRSVTIEAIEALRQRSLIELNHGDGTFTLSPVVLEYVTDRIVARAATELADGPLELTLKIALVHGQSREYVRQAQERLIAKPVLDRLTVLRSDRGAISSHLEDVLDHLRARPAEQHGFGPGNVLNLLRLLRGELRSVDVSRLTLRQVFLQDIEAQDASLSGAHLDGAILADAFSYPTCVALSGDGMCLAAGTTTGEVCVWRVVDRALLATFHGHAGLVQDVALSEDGGVLASSSEDSSIRLWNTHSGEAMATLRPDGQVRTVALSADGTIACSGDHAGTLRVWNTATSELLRTMDGDGVGVRDVALSDDGSVLVSGHADGSVRVWRSNTGARVAELSGNTSPTWGVAVAADLVASGGVDGVVRVWNLRSGDRDGTPLVGHTGAVWSVAFSSDAGLLASASFDGTVRVWDPLNHSPVATLQGHTGGVRAVTCSSNGDVLGSCSYDGTVRIWDPRSARLVATLRGHTGGVRGVAVNHDASVLVSGSYDGTVRIWDGRHGELLHRLDGHSGGAWSVALSADGRLAASGSFDGTIKLWETKTGRLLNTLRAQKNEVWGVALSVDGELVASGSYDGTMRVWDTRTARSVATLRGHTGGVWGLALGERRRVASGGEDGTVKLWDAESGQLLATLQGHVGAVWNVALSGDGKYVAGGGEDGTIRVWDADRGALVATLGDHVGGVWSVALSADGARVASGSFDGLVRVWDTHSERLLWTLTGHSGAVWSVAQSGDGSLLASGGFDGTLRLWDAQTGSLRDVLRPDRRYERMDITGLTGITAAQREALLALGAVDTST